MSNIMGNYTLPTILLILYLLVKPGISFGLKRWDKRKEQKTLLANKSLAKSDWKPYEPKRPVWKERLKYANSDTQHVAFKIPKLILRFLPKPVDEDGNPVDRPETFELPTVQRRWVTLGLHALGAICAFSAPFTPFPGTMMLIALTFLIVHLIASYLSPKWILEQKAAVRRKLTNGGTDKLKIPKEKAEAAWTVLEWDKETGLEPTILTYKLEDSFSPGSEQALLQYLNAVLTNTRTYVLDDTDGKVPVDQKSGLLSIRAKPPMPTRASFNPYYIFAPGIESGVFAIGLGDSGGAQLPIEEGSETMVTVIYVNVSGKGETYASKHGLTMIAPPTPMVLIMGPTGSGKAQALTDKIQRTRFFVIINGVKHIVKGIPYDPEHPEAPQPEWTKGRA